MPSEDVRWGPGPVFEISDLLFKITHHPPTGLFLGYTHHCSTELDIASHLTLFKLNVLFIDVLFLEVKPKTSINSDELHLLSMVPRGNTLVPLHASPKGGGGALSTTKP